MALAQRDLKELFQRVVDRLVQEYGPEKIILSGLYGQPTEQHADTEAAT